jgi:hypothetical protein
MVSFSSLVGMRGMVVVQVLVGVHAFACGGALRVVRVNDRRLEQDKGKTKPGVPAFVPLGNGGSVVIHTLLEASMVEKEKVQGYA